MPAEIAERTFDPTDAAAAVSAFATLLFEREAQPALITPDGERVDLPRPVFDALVAVARAMAEGRAVTVAPLDTKLTTQQAADLLGVSRPTLVGLLEDGAIPFEKPGRHRRVQLRDLLAYRDALRARRLDAVGRTYRESLADDPFEGAQAALDELQALREERRAAKRGSSSG
jgi:excisionase family DNA binding protein